MNDMTRITENTIKEFAIKQLSKLVELRETLLPKLMSGEIKVVENE